mmetsp:Transcript_51697/g.160902  ORF Transcript_51697/g.160902 Transcript_51697/m.160902 type:complete len:508 (-) Transcript_51697:307-1830(-)
MYHMENPMMVAGWPTASVPGPSHYWQGGNTLAVPRSLHKETRNKVIKNMKQLGAVLGSVAFLAGGVSRCRDDTDHEELFRQESNFHYVFGVAEPDCFGALMVDSGESILFVPRLPSEYAVWMGSIASLEDFKVKYEVDKVMYTDQIKDFFTSCSPTKIYLYNGVNSDSKSVGKPAHFDGIEAFPCDLEILHPALFEARVTKTSAELEVLKFANRVSSKAHITVMQKVKPDMMEYQMEADFLHYCYFNGGMRHASYTAICGCGANAAVLHYGHAGAPNNRKLMADEMILNDMGNEYYCYASDITCSFPACGKFDEVKKGIYEGVLDATVRVMKSMKPGVEWRDMHDLAENTIAEHLLKHGYLKGSMEEIIAAKIPGLFMPHGLGHLMGIDTHDVGGYPKGVERFKSLRMNRQLLEGMVLTVEPGCYFIPALLDPALKDETKKKLLCEEKLLSMFNFGGCRIEDNVIVTKDGIELMTNVPRTVKEIEAVMAGSDFPIADSDYPIPRKNL